MTFKERKEESEEGSHVMVDYVFIMAKCPSRGGNSRCKGPEVE